MKINRLINKLYANLFGYYWLPCTLCGQAFGGHEKSVILFNSKCHGKLCCINCKDKVHEKNFELGIYEENGYVVIDAKKLNIDISGIRD